MVEDAIAELSSMTTTRARATPCWRVCLFRSKTRIQQEERKSKQLGTVCEKKKNEKEKRKKRNEEHFEKLQVTSGSEIRNRRSLQSVRLSVRHEQNQPTPSVRRIVSLVFLPRIKNEEMQEVGKQASGRDERKQEQTTR